MAATGTREVGVLAGCGWPVAAWRSRPWAALQPGGKVIHAATITENVGVGLAPRA